MPGGKSGIRGDRVKSDRRSRNNANGGSGSKVHDISRSRSSSRSRNKHFSAPPANPRSDERGRDHSLRNSERRSRESSDHRFPSGDPRDGVRVRSRSRHRSSSVIKELYDSFEGGFIPISGVDTRFRRPPHPRHSSPRHEADIGQPRFPPGAGIPPQGDRRAPRTHMPPAQDSALLSRSQAFSDAQLHQLQSMFDAFTPQASSSGDFFISKSL